MSNDQQSNRLSSVRGDRWRSRSIHRHRKTRLQNASAFLLQIRQLLQNATVQLLLKHPKILFPNLL